MLRSNFKKKYVPFFFFLCFASPKHEIRGSLWDFLPQSSAEPGPHSCSSYVQLIDLSPGPRRTPAPRLPSAMLTATRIFPLARSLSASDTDTSNQLVSFNAAAEKSLILTDLYLDSLSSIYLYILRISVLPSGSCSKFTHRGNH